MLLTLSSARRANAGAAAEKQQRVVDAGEVVMLQLEDVERDVAEAAGELPVLFEHDDQVGFHLEDGFKIGVQVGTDFRLTAHLRWIVAELGHADDAVAEPEIIEHFGDRGRGGDDALGCLGLEGQGL